MQNTGTRTPATTPTHCPYCALQCGMNLTPVEGGTVEVSERTDFPVNRGALCGKGRTAAAVLAPGARLTSPLVRSGDGALVPAGWDEALDRIAGNLERTRARYGADALGVFGGGGLTNEKAYALGKFARVVLGTSQIDYNGRFCMSSAAAAGTRAFGLDRGLPFPLEDVPRTGCVILVGSNPAETMPPSLRYFTELRENGGTLIVVDPRRTKTAEQADLHLAPRPGTDLALALGMLHLVVAEGRVDEAYVEERTSGWEEARAAAMAHWPEYVERITGVSVPELREAVRLFCAPEAAMVLTARGPEQQAKGTDTVGAWINLCLATGRAGRPLSGYGCLTGQGNGQGGREHGQKADQLPGYRKLTDPAARRHVAEVWGVDPDALPGPGRSAYELLDALGTDVRSLLVMGSNPVVSAPRAAHVEGRLRSLDFLAVCDVVLSETAELADVVLPVTQWAEETGTTTSLEGRVLLRRRAITPPDGVRGDLEVLHGLAGRLGVQKGFPTDPEEVFEELRRASAGGPADYSGIDYRRLAEENGVFWPCPAQPAADDTHTADPGTGTDTRTRTGTGSGSGSGSGRDMSTETGTGSGMYTDTGTASGMSTDTGSGSTDAGIGRDPRAATGTGSGMSTDTGRVTRTATGTGSGMSTDTGSDSDSDSSDAGAGLRAAPHPGTPRLFLDRFATDDGRARFAPVTHRPSAEEPDDEYPVLLTTGRVVSQYQSGAQTRRVAELNAAAPGPFVELHPRLAARLGAADGDPLAVVSRRGRAVAPARITTGIRPDTVFMPFHWPGEGRANTLTNPALDPTSRMPEFKVCAVRVETVTS
ncbi:MULTISPECIES: molybdopterin oxidoreductase family protein [Streptomyces]|uniref:Nitrate reductase n=1 Tax=Streptomyces coelicolor (strain ATCC BAA-471 / A3(2) / M145) TaxID=100226 RepID=Q9L2E6_STRCO|nr:MULTISPECIES: molybdopterin oxidoreductase family protein [Streptomyces]MDX2924106.1 molybdopterin oxidoreductase family protein [Streptomyces sp. NRRL_B-16638]MDX3406118.1 molybdopterin oxidoreductase family protein [Streptomyces sp. ME02-6977A]MYU42000.1 molybdopterin-dependent oxidoreductase [Streptomyces sp. SID7813]QFI42615.1 molybdopterin oxidoreductase family protein [Streptomyces coelicolor A3(2)]TYP15262.1 assimilatory nitrate reductase catalytic subunit [Streptomyces coelicolor]